MDDPKFDRLFSKWAALIDRYGSSRPGMSTRLMLAFIMECNQKFPFTDLETVYNNLHTFYLIDLKLATHTDIASLECQQDILSIKKPKKNWFLVTVGFNDAEIKWREPIVLTQAHNKILEIAGIEFLGHSIEKHRKDKNKKIYIHHHIHYVVKTDYPKSKVIQFFFQKVKKFGVSTANFIDVSQNGTLETALRYVSGDKVNEKMECVALDIQWRKDTGLDKL